MQEDEVKLSRYLQVFNEEPTRGANTESKPEICEEVFPALSSQGQQREHQIEGWEGGWEAGKNSGAPFS